MMTPDEYWKTQTASWLKILILCGALVCFLMGLMTLAVIGILGIIDGALMIGLGFGIMLKRSRACAVLAAVFYAGSQFFSRLLQNELGWNYAPSVGATVISYIYIALLVLSICGTYRWQQLYRDYTASRALPGGEDTDQ
ncbi:MAG: hypothetical protein HDQ87_05845 [Clostridia bacterium]|nr:hypothetical protein [Clostridia bacterium]